MFRVKSLGRLARPIRVTLVALALVSLLAGCFPPAVTPAAGVTPEVPATTPAPTTATPGAATVTSVATSPPGTDTATPALSATAVPTSTSAITVTVIPTDIAAGMLVQKADRSIQVVDNAGHAMPLYEDTDQVDMSSIFPPGNAVTDAVYIPMNGAPGSVVKVSAFGGQPLAGITGQVYGLAAAPGKLAFGVADLSANPISSTIQLSDANGAQATSVYSMTATTAAQVLRVMRWSPDGKKLYFGKEPIGLGGYILFGGLTNLWSLDVDTGKPIELVHERDTRAAICIDDLSKDASTAADHCNPLAMELIDVATGVTRTVQLPADVPDFGTTGGARFSPDGKTLAFAMARLNPENEQGWVALADVAGATSKLIATSPANDYFSVAAWLDADTLILQSAGQLAGVWTVDTNGDNLKRLTDGVFLGMLGNQP